MNCSLEEIAKIINAQVIGAVDSINQNWRIEIDSRHIHYPEESIFVALPGTHRHGISFVPDLVKKEVSCFIIDQDIPFEENVTYFKVDNCLKAIQDLAKYHRSNFNIPCVAVTGSNGKTIIKEWLGQLLQSKYSICKNPKSYNSQLGVALSVLQLQQTHEIGLFEAGISEKNEMSRLEQMIKPSIGILSNLGDAHDAGFENRHSKLLEKIKLFKNSQYFYYPSKDSWLKENLQSIPKARSWGESDSDNVKLAFQKANGQEIQIELQHNNLSYVFDLPFSDHAYIENIVPCILISLDLQIPKEEIQKCIFHLQGFKMRLEQKEGIHGCLLVNDSYSLDISSLKLSFQFTDSLRSDQERVLIISDFPDHSSESENHKQLIYLANKYKFNTIITVGNSIKKISAQVDPQTHLFSYSTTEELLQNLDEISLKNKLILIKGARVFRMERIFEELSLSNHESILEINLNSIAHNISCYKKYLKPTTQIIAVVKASAYGSGQYEVARYLEHLGVHMLAVAYQDEAIYLRNKGIQCPLMVMNSGLADFEKLSEHNIDTVVFSIPQLNRLISEISHDSEYRIHIKLDTGMNRLGFKEEDLLDCIDILIKNPYLKIITIFSHLSASDTEQFNSFTERQYFIFQKMYITLCNKLQYNPKAHILNSGGISLHPSLQLDMVRIGIGMYGIDNNPKLKPHLEKSHCLKTKITQIKNVSSQDKISYNLTGQLNTAGKIAILSIGYADGLPRSAGLQAYEVSVKGTPCKIIGAVCMDMCMVDITNISEVAIGDEVEIFGKNCSIERLSALTGRIPYEILCGISNRVKRIFVEE